MMLSCIMYTRTCNWLSRDLDFTHKNEVSDKIQKMPILKYPGIIDLNSTGIGKLWSCEIATAQNIAFTTDLEAPHSILIVSKRFSARSLASSRLFRLLLDRYKWRGCCSSERKKRVRDQLSLDKEKYSMNKKFDDVIILYGIPSPCGVSRFPEPRPLSMTVAPVSFIMWFIYWSCKYKSQPRAAQKQSLPIVWRCQRKLKTLESLIFSMWNAKLSIDQQQLKPGKNGASKPNWNKSMQVYIKI